MKKNGYLVSILLTVLTCACTGDSVNHKGLTPLAEFNGRYFYLEQLNNTLSFNNSTEDSMRIIEKTVTDWVSDLQMEQLAERNINTIDEIERKVVEYRRQLMLYEYEKRLSEEKTIEEVSQPEIEQFYEQNKTSFVATRPLIQGLLIKVPLQNSETNKVRQWVRRANESDVENIEKFSIQAAISYEYFRDNWVPLEEVYPGYPRLSKDQIRSFAGRTFYESSDSLSFTFLKIDSFCMTNNPMPVDYVAIQIRDILQSKKGVEYMETIRAELLNKAKTDGKIHYFGSLADSLNTKK